jgi:hypothetical protein
MNNKKILSRDDYKRHFVILKPILHNDGNCDKAPLQSPLLAFFAGMLLSGLQVRMQGQAKGYPEYRCISRSIINRWSCYGINTYAKKAVFVSKIAHN